MASARPGPRIGSGKGIARATAEGAKRQARQARQQAKAAAAVAQQAATPWERLGLTWPEELFARERAADPDAPAVDIACRVEPWQGRSRGSNSNRAHNALRKAGVRQRIAELQREAVRAVEKKRRTKLSAKRVLRELAAVGLSDLRQLVEVGPDGAVRIRPSSDWPDQAAAAVSAVYNTPDGVRVQLHDKVGSLGKLAKILRLVPEPSQGIPGVSIGRAIVYIPDNQRDPGLTHTQQQAVLPPEPEADA